MPEKVSSKNRVLMTDLFTACKKKRRSYILKMVECIQKNSEYLVPDVNASPVGKNAHNMEMLCFN